MISGFALVDKPQGWTSHDVVARLRTLYGQRRVGHAGTLDPMATGVLIVGLGSATRLLRFVQDQPKTYEATIRLGAGTTTDDAEGEVTLAPGWQADPDALRRAMADSLGDIQQVPSSVSAVKVEGRRAYDRVRRGEQVELSPRQVTIRRFETTSPLRAAGPMVDVDVVVECSSGTYVRALARDLGSTLGSAGHLTALRRTAIGDVSVEQCSALGDEPPPVVPAGDVMTRILPPLSVGAEDAANLRHGRPVSVPPGVSGLCAAVDDDGNLLAVVDAQAPTARIVVNQVGQ